MKNVVITGGGHGIGRGIANKLLKDGARVFVLDSNRTFIEELEKENNAALKPFLCDVGLPEEIEKVVSKICKEYPGIDGIVNNAGISYFEPIDTMSFEKWNRILSVNLSSIFYLVKYIKSFLSEKSAIVNIASTRALMSEPDSEAYAATKGGIVALTHAMAISLSPKTRVNCISPGWIEVNDYEGLSEADHSQHPVGRVGYVDDIAEAVSFLLSEKAGFITGQNIIIDGGMTKKMIYD
jgi:Dehydrogenases with different specificities (related to short-chain alcohol dehydrogenases)